MSVLFKDLPKVKPSILRDCSAMETEGDNYRHLVKTEIFLRDTKNEKIGTIITVNNLANSYSVESNVSMEYNPAPRDNAVVMYFKSEYDEFETLVIPYLDHKGIVYTGIFTESVYNNINYASESD